MLNKTDSACVCIKQIIYFKAAMCPSYNVSIPSIQDGVRVSSLLNLAYLEWLSSKESICQSRKCKRDGFDHWVENNPWNRKW